MGRRFVFVEDVEKLLAEGQTEMKLPEGTRFSPAAADLIKEKGIRVTFTSGQAESSTKSQESEENKGRAAESGDTPLQSLIAVASSGRTINDPVENVAARSPYFLLFDRQGTLIEFLENPYRDASGGAGPLVADLLARRNVTALVAGNFGVNLRASLEEKAINYIEFSGKVEEAVRDLGRG
jgi:predicted Fe-Mo cluster-binding NifX family protein